MARINISVPDDVAARAREAGMNVSRIATLALAEELDRLAKIDAVDAYLAELDAELGPATPEERARAKEWGDRVFGKSRSDRSA